MAVVECDVEPLVPAGFVSSDSSAMVGLSTAAVAGAGVVAGVEVALRCGATIVELDVRSGREAPVVAFEVPRAHRQFLRVSVGVRHHRFAAAVWSHSGVADVCPTVLPAYPFPRLGVPDIPAGVLVANTDGSPDRLGRLFDQAPTVGFCLDVSAAYTTAGPGAAAGLARRFGSRIGEVRVGAIPRGSFAGPLLEPHLLGEFDAAWEHLAPATPVVVERRCSRDDDHITNLAAVAATIA